MPVAAVPSYLGQEFEDASPGMRFGMYLKLWGVNREQNKIDWRSADRVWPQQKKYPRWEDQDNKKEAIEAACVLTPNDKKILKTFYDRQCALASLATEVLVFHGQSTAPFTTGLGNEHPLENGFAFLWPYGLPYLPGSGVKGVLRQAARELAPDVEIEGMGQWDVATDWSAHAIEALFGSEDSNDAQRGALQFWDVMPQIKGDRLMVEIMTPHQKHYYQGNEPPHDSGQPTPISFLTVPPDSGFTFHVQCDRVRLQRLAPELARNARWRVLLEAAFEHAFDWLGFGAKTAVGYGAMRLMDNEECQAQAEKAKMDSLRCGWVDEQIGKISEETNSKPEEVLRGKRLANAWQSIDDPELKAAALADIQARWQAHGWWDNPPSPAAKKTRSAYDAD